MTTFRAILKGAGIGLVALAAQPALADEIVIGGALSLTGVQAPLDEPGFRGAQVAVKYLNDNGGPARQAGQVHQS